MSEAAATLPNKAFWYLRHGETDWNARGVSQGNIDIPLNETGIAQAHAAAAALRGRGIVSIVSSPLSRAWDTAMTVAAALGLEPTVQDDLHEVDFGVQEGAPMVDAWFSEWVTGTATPDGAESFAALRARAAGAVATALLKPSPVLVVAHGALFRALRADMGLPANVRLANAQPLFCTPGAHGAPWSLTPAV